MGCDNHPCVKTTAPLQESNGLSSISISQALLGLQAETPESTTEPFTITSLRTSWCTSLHTGLQHMLPTPQAKIQMRRCWKQVCWHSWAAGSGVGVPLIGSRLGLGGSQLSGQGLAHGLALTQLGGQAHPEALHHVHHARHLPRQGPLHDLLLPGQGSLPGLCCTQLSLQYRVERS